MTSNKVSDEAMAWAQSPAVVAEVKQAVANPRPNKTFKQFREEVLARFQRENDDE